jgi:hypothetical protein
MAPDKNTSHRSTHRTQFEMNTMTTMQKKELDQVPFYKIINHLEAIDQYSDILEHAISETLLANLDIADSKLKLLKDAISFKTPHDMPNNKYRMLGFDEDYEIGDEWLIGSAWEVIKSVGEDNYVCMHGCYFRRRI